MHTDVLQSPNLTLSASSNETLNYTRDSHNYITQLFGEQLPAIRTGFFNVHMTRDIVIQPHWHTNVTEMVFVVSGEAITSVLNPFTRKLMTYHLQPGDVSIFPKGWFHWIVAASDHVHLLAIFDRPTPDIVYGSDFLSRTPDIVRQAYCIDPQAYAQAVAPAHDAAILGPAIGCGAINTGYGTGTGPAPMQVRQPGAAVQEQQQIGQAYGYACPALRPFGSDFAHMYPFASGGEAGHPDDWSLGYGY